MAKFKIRIYKSAENDLEDIVEYINTLSPAVLCKLYIQILFYYI